MFKTIRLALLDEMKLPDFKGRHLFIAKLRLIIFILCWILFVFFVPHVWQTAPWVPLSFNIAFLVTAICYWNIIHSRAIMQMGFLEIIADIFSQTALVYLLGPSSNIVFLFYGMYVIAAGTFFGYITALIAATVALIFYFGLISILWQGWLEYYPLTIKSPDFFDDRDFSIIFNTIFLPITFAVVVYGARIAHFFSSLKEKALETRNNQLLALNRIGSTIRSTVQPNHIIDQTLKGVIQGLGFDICFLALQNKSGQKIFFHVSNDHPDIAIIEEILGHHIHDYSLNTQDIENSILQAINNNQVIERSHFGQLTFGFNPKIDNPKAEQIQQRLGYRKYIITPLVAEKKVMGALIGATKFFQIDESIVDSLDHFANQAALAIETAQLIEELKLKNIELKEANRVKSDFLAIMSHELRTPLTAIIGYSEILLEDVWGVLNNEQNHSLNEVLRNARELLQLINSILDLAKVEAGKMQLNLDTLSLKNLLEEVNQTMVPLIKKKKHKLIIHAGNHLPLIIADYQKLRQVVINLIGNAIKFTPEEGQIDVGVDYYLKGSMLDDQFDDMDSELKDNPVFLLWVRDNGIGIKKEHLDQVFDIFRQADSTFTRKYQGTGLGLSLSRQLIELHHGHITLESEFGVGSEFKILLPEKQKEALKENES